MGLSARLPYDCLVMRASTYPPASLMLLVVLNVCTKVAVGCALARFVDLRRMILIAKLAFVFALTLLFAGDRLLPLPLADSSLPYLIFMGILMATLQQLIVTFGLVFTVRTAPSGMEAALTSLNDLTLDMICFSYKKSISLRSIASLYVPHSRMVDGLIVFFSLYSFFRVFGKAQEAAMLDRGSLDVISPASSSIQLPLPVKDFGISTNPLVGESLSEHSSSAVDRQDSLKGVGARKSPWAVESEYSDASS
ncbi:HAMP domain-containing protein [Babesia caballi]|uniref:HAMP domain-containing protein n=1 Tax=Babesia caballi TaxID=5871 RepID=A0AAV4LVV7_BABCB|nr:HAMP domain-containing protein [Babesia caballi]